MKFIYLFIFLGSMSIILLKYPFYLTYKYITNIPLTLLIRKNAISTGYCIYYSSD